LRVASDILVTRLYTAEISCYLHSMESTRNTEFKKRGKRVKALEDCDEGYGKLDLASGKELAYF